MLFRSGSGTGAVVRELAKLADSGLVTVNKIGNQKHYQANRQAPIYEELRGIVLKTFGIGDLLRQALAELAGQIKVAFVYGSIAKRTDTAGSDIDVMIISDNVSYSDLFSALAAIETKLGRSVSPTLYHPAEFQSKLASDSSFVTRVVEQPKIFLIGTDNDIPKP